MLQKINTSILAYMHVEKMFQSYKLSVQVTGRQHSPTSEGIF